MQISLATASALDLPADALVLFEPEEKEPSALAATLDARLGGRLARAREHKELSGKLYETTWLHAEGGVPAGRVLVVGTGKRDELDAERARRVGTVAVRQLRRRDVTRAVFVLDAGLSGDLVQPIVDGAVSGEFDNGVYKTADRETKPLAELTVGVASGAAPAGWGESLARGVAIGEAANFARRLAIEPGNRMTPRVLSERAMAMAREKGLEADVLGRERLAALGAGALLGVAGGSDEPPALIVLRYRSGREGGPVFAIVGKGVTFDSGGISIKPANGMHEMKYDMAGAAAALGAMQAIADLKPNVDVIGLVPAVENMLSGRSMRPGDVLTSMSGKTIEVTNTDAEGRLILADAICYAHKLGATHVIDAATLTGGVVTALGHHATGLFGTPDTWRERVQAVALRVGERVWPLPLYPEYREQLKSDVADIGNAGGRTGSPCTAATFIKEFVADGLAWAHLDVAGTAWTTSDKPYMASGPTGVALRTFVALAQDLAAG